MAVACLAVLLAAPLAFGATGGLSGEAVDAVGRFTTSAHHVCTDAEQTLTDARLTVGAVSNEFSDTVPAGDVISQVPAAGETVDKGSAVDYVVSDGIEQVEVPDFSGPAADAEQVAIFDNAGHDLIDGCGNGPHATSVVTVVGIETEL